MGDLEGEPLEDGADDEDVEDEEEESGIGDADGLAEQTGLINGALCDYVA